MSPILSSLTYNWTSFGGGVDAWIATLSNSQKEAYGNGVAVDSAGNAYVGGTSIEVGHPTYDRRIYYSKFDPTGALQFQKLFGHGGMNHGNDIALDSSGNIYTCGDHENSGYKPTLAKFTSAGARSTSHQINNSGELTTLKVTSSGTRYLAGNIEGTNWPFNSNNRQGFILKVLPNGNEDWWRLFYNGNTNVTITPQKSFEIDSSENLYMCFKVRNHDKLSVIKYNSSGNQTWQVSLQGFSGSYCETSGLAIDSSGNVYVAGNENDNNNGIYNAFLTKFNSAGNLQWSRKIRDVFAKSLETDSSGNVFMVGLDASNNMQLVKWNSSGSIQFQQKLSSNRSERFEDIAIDSNDNLYCSGWSEQLNSRAHVILVKLPGDGSVLGTASHWTLSNTTHTETSHTWNSASATDSVNTYNFAINYQNETSKSVSNSSNTSGLTTF